MNSSIFNHHAYFSIGDEVASGKIITLLEESGFKTSGNPDFWQSHFDNFGIEESRFIKEMDSRQSASGRKVFLVSFNSTTTEAQNALLKTVEEPLGGSHFFFCVPSEESLLATLRSRLLYLPLEVKTDNLKEVQDFLKMSVDERLAFAHKMSDDFKKGKLSKKDEINFLNNLEKALYLATKPPSREDSEKIKKFLELKSFASIRGSSVKMILETTAVILPVSE